MAKLARNLARNSSSLQNRPIPCTRNTLQQMANNNIFDSLFAFDTEAVVTHLKNDPTLWSATSPVPVNVAYRPEAAFMLGDDVAATPLSVAVRLAKKLDKRKGGDMIKEMLKVLEVSSLLQSHPQPLLLISPLLSCCEKFRPNPTATGRSLSFHR